MIGASTWYRKDVCQCVILATKRNMVGVLQVGWVIVEFDTIINWKMK